MSGFVYSLCGIILYILLMKSTENGPQQQLHVKSLLSEHKRIAYGILVHNNDTFYGMKQLIDKIDDKEHCFIVHIDKKYNMTATMNKSNVFMYQEYNITWGSYQMTESMVYLTTKAYEKCTFDIFQFLDGTTYPLHHKSRLQEFYDQLDDSIVMSSVKGFRSGKACTKKTMYVDPCKRTRSKCLTNDCTTLHNTPSNKMLYKGMQWVTLQYDFIKYMNDNPEWMTSWLEFFKPHRLNDEMFFQTILMDSGFKHQTLEKDIVQTVWGRCKSYKNWRSRKRWSPCLMGKKDFGRIEWDSLFLRKLQFDEPLKEMIDDYDYEIDNILEYYKY